MSLQRATHANMSGEGEGPGLPYSGGCSTALSGGSAHIASHSSLVLRSSSSLESYSPAVPFIPSPMPLLRRRVFALPSPRIISLSSARISSTSVGSLYCFEATGRRKLVREDRDDSRLGELSESEDEDDEERRCLVGEAGWRMESLETGRRSVNDGSGGECGSGASEGDDSLMVTKDERSEGGQACFAAVEWKQGQLGGAQVPWGVARGWRDFRPPALNPGSTRAPRGGLGATTPLIAELRFGSRWRQRARTAPSQT